jgi:hypothetical protein
MALKKDFTTSQGIELKNAYIRVYGVDCATKNHALAKIGVQVAEGKPVIDQLTASFDLDLNGSNPFAQAYAFAKTLPAFAGAQDC